MINKSTIKEGPWFIRTLPSNKNKYGIYYHNILFGSCKNTKNKVNAWFCRFFNLPSGSVYTSSKLCLHYLENGQIITIDKGYSEYIIYKSILRRKT